MLRRDPGVRGLPRITSYFLDDHTHRLAALLVAHIPPRMLAPRALPNGVSDRPKNGIYSWEAPYRIFWAFLFLCSLTNRFWYHNSQLSGKQMR